MTALRKNNNNFNKLGEQLRIKNSCFTFHFHFFFNSLDNVIKFTQDNEMSKHFKQYVVLCLHKLCLSSLKLNYYHAFNRKWNISRCLDVLLECIISLNFMNTRCPNICISILTKIRYSNLKLYLRIKRGLKTNVSVKKKKWRLFCLR